MSCTKFTNLIDDKSLPVYSHKNIIVRDFNDDCVDIIMDIEGKIVEDILNSSEQLEMAHIPCYHFYVDFRN